MCYESKCNKCGKTTWGGCGRHVTSVYNRIPEGQHCTCKDWPGVKSSSGADDASAPPSTSSSSSCGIL